MHNLHILNRNGKYQCNKKINECKHLNNKKGASVLSLNWQDNTISIDNEQGTLFKTMKMLFHHNFNEKLKKFYVQQ